MDLRICFVSFEAFLLLRTKYTINKTVIAFLIILLRYIFNLKLHVIELDVHESDKNRFVLSLVYQILESLFTPIFLLYLSLYPFPFKVKLYKKLYIMIICMRSKMSMKCA